MSRRNDPQANTEELAPNLLNVVTYHGRDYQQYAIDNNISFAPIDEDEIDRLLLQHNVLCKVFDDRMIFPPLNNPQRILDCGYGTASWALDVAEQYPDCKVVGVDVSAHAAPDDHPDNIYLQSRTPPLAKVERVSEDAEDTCTVDVERIVTMEYCLSSAWRFDPPFSHVDDLNRRFTFPSNYFDLVHSQLVAGGINRSRWNSYLRDIFKATKRGGWVQMVEVYYNVQSDNGSLTDENALRQWSRRYLQALEGIKDLRIPLRLTEVMRAAGLVDVEQRALQLPTCGWPSAPRENGIGRANRDNVQQFLSSLAIFPLTERLGMTPGEVQLLIAQARLEADNPSYKAYFPLYVCIGRKPRR